MQKTCKTCNKHNTPLCKFKMVGDFALEACFEWEGINQLETMFEMQKKLQKDLGTMPKFFDEVYIKDMILASIVELTEILNETPWKPWKKQQKLEPAKYQEEIADLMHFVINLCIVGGIDADKLFEMYCNKNKINHNRNKEGY